MKTVSTLKIRSLDSYPALFAAALISRHPDWINRRQPDLLTEVVSSAPKSAGDVVECLAAKGLSDPSGIESARQTAQPWMDAGMGVAVVGESEHLMLFTQGDASLLDSKTSAVLNSRTPKQLHPYDRWVTLTKHLLGNCIPLDHAIVSSMGNYSYELAGYLAVRSGRNLIVVCDRILPGMADGKAVLSDALAEFSSHPQVLLVSPFFPGHKVATRQKGVIRDTCVVALADAIWACEIRGGGNIERLCLEALGQHKRVSAFKPKRFNRATKGNKGLIEAGAIPVDIPTAETDRPKRQSKHSPVVKPVSFTAEQRFFHFTRACPGPWPGQSAFDYYRAVADNEPGSAHTAFDTLLRILEERRIRGSNRLTRGPEQVVSFSAGGLDELGRMIKWRTGFARWTFEPYGIGFSRSVLMERGARPVVYGDESVWKRLPETQQYRYQVSRPGNREWEREKEWRLKGDLAFESVPDRDILVVTALDYEAEAIRRRFGLKAVSVLVSEKW
jgi:hypothetical protein